jgi:hypothetical protein
VYENETRAGIGNRAEPFSRLPEMLQIVADGRVSTKALRWTGQGAVARPLPAPAGGGRYSP